jgi:hypothetical protein
VAEDRPELDGEIMKITKRQLRKLVREAMANNYGWETSSKQNMLLHKDGMEQSDKDNQEKYLKSMGMMESSLRSYIRDILSEKKWEDLNAPKGQIINLEPEDFEVEACDEPPCPEIRDLDDEIFDLIQNAYSDVELEPGQYGNAKVRSPSDLPAGYSIMKAADIDGDPEPDFFRGGKSRGGRFKLGIVGHDGSQAAIDMYLEKTAEELKSGAIAEMSGKIAHIMITRHGVPAVTSKEGVESMLGKAVEWIGPHPDAKYASRYGDAYEGWYSRSIGGGDHMKILLGGV